MVANIYPNTKITTKKGRHLVRIVGPNFCHPQKFYRTAIKTFTPNKYSG